LQRKQLAIDFVQNSSNNEKRCNIKNIEEFSLKLDVAFAT